jgi:hypothetical protein
MKAFHFVVLSIVMISLFACSGQPKVIYEEVSPASLKPGDAIPSPSGEVILTVSGNINVKNNGDLLELDLTTLEKFGLVKYDIDDPWAKTTVNYTGVLLSDFLKIVGASPTAENIHIIALDDYEVDITVTEAQKWPVLLATQSNDQYMTVAENGPTRIIFPFGRYSDIEIVLYQDLSIWSIKSIEVQ